VDLSPALARLRLVKSAEELAAFRAAAAAIEAGMAAGVEATVEGATEREIAAAIARALVQAGADTPIPGIVATGERLGQVHAIVTDRRLRRGDLIRLEQSNSVNRYWARLMRTLSIGRPPTEVLDLYERMRAVQDEQLAQMRPGAIPAELDGFVRERMPAGLWHMQLSGYALAFHERSVIGGEADRLRITAR